jgi:hypothetical protein
MKNADILLSYSESRWDTSNLVSKREPQEE